jgi:hypothetical protein
MSAEDVKGGPVIPVETVPQPLGDPSFYDAAGKSPQQIEADIDHTRTELGEILDALERRLAPRHMLERGVDMLKETMSGNTGKIGETLRDNPVPLALIGLGVGWMLLSSTGATRRLSEASGQLGEQLGAQASGVGERVSGLGDRLTGTVRSLGQRAGAWAGSVKERFAGSGASSEEAYPTGAME